MTYWGPVSEATHGWNSNPSFDLAVGLIVLAFTWIGFFKNDRGEKINFWIAIGISAICGVFIYSGVKGLAR